MLKKSDTEKIHMTSMLLNPLYLDPSIITVLYFCKGGIKLRFDTSSMKIG